MRALGEWRIVRVSAFGLNAPMQAMGKRAKFEQFALPNVFV
jgi:hypothetical protein